MNIQKHNQKRCAKLSIAIFAMRYNTNKVFFTILYTLCILLSLIGFIFDINPFIKVSVLVSLVALLFLSIRVPRCYVPVYIYAGFLAMFFLVSSLFVGRTGGMLVTPSHFIPLGIGAAMILVRGRVYSWSGYIVFYSLAGYFSVLMLAGVDANMAIYKNSCNSISIIMLVACISLYIISGMEGKKIDLKPAFLNLVISVWGIGRSGVIASLIVFFGLLSVRFQAKKKYKCIVAVSLIMALIVCYIYWDHLLALAKEYSFSRNAAVKFSAQGLDLDVNSPRWTLWTNYFNNLDIFRLLFGVNVENDPFPTDINHLFNYHNSFIMIHLQTGLMGLISIAFIVAALFKFYRTNKVFFFLLLALTVRGMTDSLFFFNRFDFIPLFFIFYSLKGFHLRTPFANRGRHHPPPPEGMGGFQNQRRITFKLKKDIIAR